MAKELSKIPKVAQVGIDDLKEYERNARAHPKAQIDLLIKNIERFGFTTPVLIDKDNTIIAGHGRVVALKQMGITRVPVVRMEDLTRSEANALRLADNKLAEMAEWDTDLLVEDLGELPDDLFDLTGFDKDLLLGPDEKDDQVPTNAPTRAKLGDLWQLGPHKVLCGDSTDSEAVSRLMGGVKADMVFADPPYNVAYDNTFRGTKHKAIANDKMSGADFRKFLTLSIENLMAHTDGALYICMSAKELGTLKEVFEAVGGHWSDYIVWVKNHLTLSQADYQHICEHILYGWREGTKHYFIEERDRHNVWESIDKVKTEFDGTHTTISFKGYKLKLEGNIKGEVLHKKQRINIWRHDKPTKSVDHPTMKPVALVSEAIINSSQRDGIVLDTFLGSGSTLIAAEKTGRLCYGIELDPKYVDVILKRWEDFTGKKAEKTQ